MVPHYAVPKREYLRRPVFWYHSEGSIDGCFKQHFHGSISLVPSPSGGFDPYEDVNDAQRLSRDPVMRAIVDRKGLDRMAASTSQMGRFETEWLATDDNLAALTALSGVWIDRQSFKYLVD